MVPPTVRVEVSQTLGARRLVHERARHLRAGRGGYVTLPLCAAALRRNGATNVGVFVESLYQFRRGKGLVRD